MKFYLDISGEIVVWGDYRNCKDMENLDNTDIYGYNLDTREEFAICTDPGDQGNPHISGNTVVWADWQDNKIYGARLAFE